MKILSTGCSDLSKAAEIKTEGADEIILGLKDQTFSAMHEYDLQTILSFLPDGHKMGLSVSVLMNRLYGQTEIAQAQQLLSELLDQGIDAVYFADPGLFEEAVRMHRENRMIYDPQTLLTSSEDASFWMDQKLKSAVISPLLTKAEIMQIAERVSHLSLIVHGRQMMSVSKRHLLQAYGDAGGKKMSFAGNPHLTMREGKREGRMPVYENRFGTMIYTDFVQESFHEMNDFIKSGVERFIIEDIFLPENAWLDAVGAYRRILDGADASETGEEYRKRYGNLPLSNGYYGQKTIR